MRLASDAFAPLHSEEAEMSALGSMIFSARAVEQVLAILSADDFYLPSHRRIFEAMEHLATHNQPVDLVSLKITLGDRGHLEEVGGEDYLINLAEFVPSAANAAYYAQQVLERATARRLDEAGHGIISVARQGDLTSDDRIDKAERLVFEVGNKRLGKDFEHIQPLAKKFFDEVDTVLELGEPLSGLPSGFYDLDELTTGFYPGDLAIVAARPSMGKTSLVLSMALHAARKNQTVAVFSLEMGALQLTRRIVSMISQITGDRMKRPDLDNRDYKKLADAVEIMWELPIYIDETSDISGLEMRGKCRRLQREHGLGLIIVDYLQLMSGKARTENRVQEISEIARSLKGLAKELQVPVIALSQLNRSVESRDNKRPQLSDIRESGSIEAEADIVMFIYRDAYYKDRAHPEEANTDPLRIEEAEILIAKHRNGPTGTIKLGFTPGLTLFRNLERNSPARRRQREDVHAAVEVDSY